jgi:hypothetical protein
MAREDFYSQLSQVLGQAQRPPGKNGTNGRAATLRESLAGSDRWLSSDTVADFDVQDFADWPASIRKSLAAAVDRFRAATAGVTDRPLTDERRKKAVDALAEIIEIVQPIVRAEWTGNVEEFIRQAEEWGRARDWAIRRYPKEGKDALLGRYQVPQLLVHLPEARVMLDPVGRFVAGGTGLVDLYAMPSLAGRSVVRREQGWRLLPDKATGRVKDWSEEVFDSVVRELAREAS